MQRQDTKLDFTDQHIFVGLDIAARSWKTSILTEQCEHKTFTQPPNADILVKYLRRTFPGARYHCVYEASYCGFWIHEELTKAGIDCMVVNPADVPSTHKEQVRKTDRVDARKLAQRLRQGELGSIYVPHRNALEDRSLLRTRFQFVSKLTRCKNQIKGLLRFYGVTIPEQFDNSHWSLAFIQWLESIPMQHASGNSALNALLTELRFLRQGIAQVTKEIGALAQQEAHRDAVALLRTIPGISTLTAMTLLTELVDLGRFSTPDHLASYVGLVPGEHSSGERTVITGICPRRNPLLRFVLIEASWMAVRRDPALLSAFETLARRMPKQQAIIRIARKLLNRIRYVLLHREPYVPAVVCSRN